MQVHSDIAQYNTAMHGHILDLKVGASYWVLVVFHYFLILPSNRNANKVTAIVKMCLPASYQVGLITKLIPKANK